MITFDQHYQLAQFSKLQVFKASQGLSAIKQYTNAKFYHMKVSILLATIYLYIPQNSKILELQTTVIASNKDLG